MEVLGAVYKRMKESGKFEHFTKMNIVFLLFLFIGIVVIISIAVKTKTTKGISRAILICFIHSVVGLVSYYTSN